MAADLQGHRYRGQQCKGGSGSGQGTGYSSEASGRLERGAGEAHRNTLHTPRDAESVHTARRFTQCVPCVGHSCPGWHAMQA
jgi:hypothetical protein